MYEYYEYNVLFDEGGGETETSRKTTALKNKMIDTKKNATVFILIRDLYPCLSMSKWLIDRLIDRLIDSGANRDLLW